MSYDTVLLLTDLLFISVLTAMIVTVGMALARKEERGRATAKESDKAAIRCDHVFARAHRGAVQGRLAGVDRS